MTELSENDRRFLVGLAFYPGLFKRDDLASACRLRDVGLVEFEVFDHKAGIWIGKATRTGLAIAKQL